MVAHDRPLFARWCGCLLLLLLTGCQTTVNKGPVYKLPVPQERVPATPVAVSVTDKRPDSEKKYHQGAVTPCDYRQGIEILTLDNFEPQITNLIKQACIERLGNLSTAPVWADIELTHFRVSIDRREILAIEYERQLEAQELAPVVGVGAGLASGEGMPGVIGGLGGGLVAAAMAANKIQEVENDRMAWGVADGVSCEMTMRVELHWDGGYREVVNLEAKTHSMAPDGLYADLLRSERWEVAPAVDQAIVQITDRLFSNAQRISARVKSGGAAVVAKGPPLERPN